VLRELIYVPDAVSKVVADLAWQATDAILAIKKLVDTAAETGLDVDPDALAHRKRLLKPALVLSKSATSGWATKLGREYHALFTRMINRWDDYLRYTHDQKIHFDINAAEQTIRMPKVPERWCRRGCRVGGGGTPGRCSEGWTRCAPAGLGDPQLWVQVFSCGSGGRTGQTSVRGSSPRPGGR
jgi:hypothetical protein